MKVMYLTNALTHYYNGVLSKLNAREDVDLVVVAPKGAGRHVGEGVYQTKEGTSFRLHEREEIRRFGLYTSFRGMIALLIRERPQIIVLPEHMLLAFVLGIPLMLATKILNIRIVQKSIPFRLLEHDEAKSKLQKLPAALGGSSPVIRVVNLLKLARLARRARLMLMKLAYNSVDAHVVYVDAGIEIYGSYGVPKEKVFVIGNSPDTDQLREIEQSLIGTDPILPNNDYRLIHVGRLVEWKRVDLLLRALRKVSLTFPRTELLIAGYGPEEEKLIALADELGLHDNVHFLGGVYDPRLLARYMRSSSVYVLAGMGGISINDAMFFRLPVICSVCDGTEKKLVREGINGSYFAEGDENDLAERIIKLFSDPSRCRQMGNASRDIIDKEVNIHTVVGGYVRAFDYVLNARGATAGQVQSPRAR